MSQSALVSAALLIALASFAPAQGTRPVAIPSTPRVVLPEARDFRHRENITMYFDDASGYGTVQLGPMTVAPEIQLKALFKYKGRTLASTPAKVSIAVISTSDRARHASSKQVYFTSDADGRRSHPVLVRVPEQLDGKVRETMALSLTTRALVGLANAHAVAGQVGEATFSLTDAQLEALRDFASRMDVEVHKKALAKSGGAANVGIGVVPASAYTAADVDRRATQRGGLVPPGYPSIPLDQRARRSVTIQFVVDTSGKADTATLRSQLPADSAFARAVREVIDHWQFVPARKGGNSVRQLMVQAIPFDPGPAPASPVAIDTSRCASSAGAARVPATAFLEMNVHSIAVSLPENPEPRYPADARRPRGTGEVLTQFVVDDSGAIVWCTFRVVRATAPQFEASVREAMASWRFEPATIYGQPVAQFVERGFVLLVP